MDGRTDGRTDRQPVLLLVFLLYKKEVIFYDKGGSGCLKNGTFDDKWEKGCFKTPIFAMTRLWAGPFLIYESCKSFKKKLNMRPAKITHKQ